MITDRDTMRLVAFVAAANAGAGLESKSPEELRALSKGICETDAINDIMAIVGPDASHVLNNYVLVWGVKPEVPAGESPDLSGEGSEAIAQVRRLFMENKVEMEDAVTMVRGQGLGPQAAHDMVFLWYEEMRAKAAQGEPEEPEGPEEPIDPSTAPGVWFLYQAGTIDEDRARELLHQIGLNDFSVAAAMAAWNDTLERRRHPVEPSAEEAPEAPE